MIAKKGFTVTQFLLIIGGIWLFILIVPNVIEEEDREREVQIKKDVRMYENQIEYRMMTDGNSTTHWSEIDLVETGSEIFNKLGKVDMQLDLKGDYYLIKKEEFKIITPLKGTFFMSSYGEVYYSDVILAKN